MAKLNPHYQKLPANYLFSQIEERVDRHKEQVPGPLINLGIGDVTQPIPPTLIQAFIKGVEEMGHPEAFKGYGPSCGYPFLREAIAQGDYKGLGISPDEIFISTGAQGDIAHLQEIFCVDNRVALPDPTYPVYLDTTIMAGRQEGIQYLPCTEENRFCPEPPDLPCDLIYLCSPNNPTGQAMDRKLLKRWVDYAMRHRAILFLDGAYEAYITTPGTPRSIYEVEGAKNVAIEVRSFSKNAGFSGLRCSYTVVPHSLQLEGHSLHALWSRRQNTKFNGVSYPIQVCTAAIYTPQGRREVEQLVHSYSERALFLKKGLEALGYTVYGGVDAPYVWLKIPPPFTSWGFFDHLLNNAAIISVPGVGFGKRGESFIRLSAFADLPLHARALERLRGL